MIGLGLTDYSTYVQDIVFKARLAVPSWGYRVPITRPIKHWGVYKDFLESGVEELE